MQEMLVVLVFVVLSVIRSELSIQKWDIMPVLFFALTEIIILIKTFLFQDVRVSKTKLWLIKSTIELDT
jgi:hypothetical protein